MNKGAFSVFVMVLCLLITMSEGLKAQKYVDVLEGTYEHCFGSEYVDSAMSFDCPVAHIAVRLPHAFDNGDVILTKLSYLQGSISNFSDTYNTESFYITYVELAYHKKLSDRAAVEFGVLAKAGSLTGQLNGKCMVMPALAAFRINRSENFSWGLGCMYSYEMFGHFVVPMVLWDWKISDKLYFKGDFPVKGYLMYIPTDRFSTGILMTSSTSSVRLDQKYNYGYMTRAYADAAVFADISLTKRVVFRIKGGFSFMRSYDVFADGDKLGVTLSAFKLGDNRTQLNSDVNDVPFIQAGLFYRYHY